MRTPEQRESSREAREQRRRARRARRRGSYVDVEFELDGSTGRSGRYDKGTTLYRSRKGMICGVCKGLAEYYNFDVFWVRVLAVLATSMTGFWPAVIMYFIAAMVMKVEPVMPLETEEDEEFYHSYSGSRTMALQRLKRTYENLDRRIQRIESTVTKRDFDWERRLNS